MMFPEISRKGDAAHARAIEQLTRARDDHRDLAKRADAAAGTTGEEQAADARDAARADVTTKDAWVGWIEHGV